MLDAFDHEYIPEHLLTQEFLQEVKSLLAPGGVLAANTFSSSGLYEHESVTYAKVFGKFFNLKRENRVILARLSALPDRQQLRTTAQQFSGSFDRYGFEAAELLPLFTQERDWDPRRASPDRSVLAGEPAQPRALGTQLPGRVSWSARLTSCSCGRSPPVMFSPCAVESSSASFFHDSRILRFSSVSRDSSFTTSIGQV